MNTDGHGCDYPPGGGEPKRAASCRSKRGELPLPPVIDDIKSRIGCCLPNNRVWVIEELLSPPRTWPVRAEVLVQDLIEASGGVLHRDPILVGDHEIQNGDYWIGVCPEEVKCGKCWLCLRALFKSPVQQEVGHDLGVLGIDALEERTPLGGTLTCPLQEIWEGVRAHVEEGFGLGLFVCLYDPFAQLAALVGGFLVAGEDAEEHASGESGADQGGEFLPMSPHGGILA
jgi:hypothetical protein